MSQCHRGEFGDGSDSAFSAKPLPVENMILVQDKGTWSQAPTSQSPSLAMPTIQDFLVGGRPG